MEATRNPIPDSFEKLLPKTKVNPKPRKHNTRIQSWQHLKTDHKEVVIYVQDIPSIQTLVHKNQGVWPFYIYPIGGNVHLHMLPCKR
eukprot:2053960-Ditylum_brightwellii.AAC.2